LSYRGDLTIGDFIATLIEAATILHNKIKHTNKTIQSYAQQRNQCSYRGSVEDSHRNLTVNVIEA
jgi:hypothetical protein